MAANLKSTTSKSFDLKIFHQNIRSLRENFDKFVSNLYSFNDLPAIIFLSEIWIYDYELSFYKIPDYTSFACCNGNYRAGGVCVFYNDRLNCSCESISLNSADIIKLSLNINKVNYIFICIYRLQFVPTSNFVNEFSGFIEKIKNKNLVILGDLNIDIHNFPPMCDDYIFMMSSNGLQSLINTPTRITNRSSTCIDHCFVRSIYSGKVSALSFNLQISDHHLICVIVEINCNVLKNNVVKSNFRKFDNFEVSKLLSTYDFSSLLIESDPTVILTQLIFILKSVLDSCIIINKKHKTKMKLKP